MLIKKPKKYKDFSSHYIRKTGNDTGNLVLMANYYHTEGRMSKILVDKKCSVAYLYLSIKNADRLNSFVWHQSCPVDNNLSKFII